MHSEPSASRLVTSSAVGNLPGVPDPEPRMVSVRRAFTSGWNWLVCRIVDHSAFMNVTQYDEGLCIKVHCQRCGCGLMHLDIPHLQSVSPERLH